MFEWRGRSDLTAGTPDLLTAVPVHDALLHAIGVLPQILERERSVHHAVDTHAPEGLVVQLVAFEADQLGNAKAERALEDPRITDEGQRLADGQRGDWWVVTGAQVPQTAPNDAGQTQ